MAWPHETWPLRAARPLLAAALAWTAALMPARAIETLDDALIAAYLANAELAAARADLRALDDELAIALAPGRPNLSLSSEGRFERRWEAGDAQENFRDQHRLVLSQSLYQGGAVRAAEKAALAQIEAGRARLRAQEQSVFLDVVDAYTALTRDGKVMALADRNVLRLERHLDAEQLRFAAGENTKTDIAQARARLAGAVAEFARAAAAIERSAATFASLVGEPIGGRFRPAMPAPGLPSTLDDALGRARDHPDVIASREEARAAESAVAQALASVKPRLTVDAQLGYASTPIDETGDERTVASVGAVFDWPLYQGGGDYARARRARQLASRSKHLVEQAERSAIRRATDFWRAYEATLAARRSIEAQAAAAATALDGVRREREVGARTTLDVLDAEQEVFAADVALAEAERDLVLASFAVKAAIGELDALRLELAVERYDPNFYHDQWSDAWFGFGDEQQDGSPRRPKTP